MGVGVLCQLKVALSLIFFTDEGKEGVAGEVKPGGIIGCSIREDIFRSGGDAGYKVRICWRGATVDRFGDESASFIWVPKA